MLGALRVQQSTYGIAVPVIFGRCRVPVNLGWYGDFKAIAHTETTQQGGKGGGGVKQKTTTYTYEAATVGFIGEGPITGVRSVWQGKKKFDSIDQLNLGLMVGDYGQAVWGYLSTNHPDQAIGYSGIAYVMSAAFQLTQNAEVENHTLEVDGFLQYNGGPDCNPRDVVVRMLTNTSYGVGLPASRIDDTTAYSNYCLASGLLISVALTEQAAARDTLGELLRMTNTGAVWSGGKLKLVPYGDQQITGNGVTFTPNVTPEYDLTDDDFLAEEAADPVKVRRKSPSDRYNHVQVEFINSANGYNIETVDAKDDADIERNGLRTMQPVKMHALPNADVAGDVAQMLLQRSLYICNEYEFRLGWRFIRLEPMDLVTLTCARTYLDKTPVRIISVEENEDGDLTVIAEDFPLGSASAARYTRQQTLGYTPNYNAAAGNVNEPVFIEPPDQLVSGLEVRLAVSGTTNYGGCYVWVSFDGDTYKKVGEVDSPARHGVLTAALQAGDELDTVNTLQVDLTVSGGNLLSASQDDARNLRTLCYVDGELLAYETATLTAAGKYSLSNLVRGAYGTPIGGHNANTQFVRMDEALFKLPFATNDIGKTINVKLQAFNPLGGGLQALEDIHPYTYVIKGSALNSPLPDVANLVSNFVSGLTQLHWDPVTDFRSPIDYEVRIGDSWEVGRLIARTPLTSLPAVGDGQYWVAAHYRSPLGVDAYSATPESILIVGSVLTKNIVATNDEAATSWTGSASGGARAVGSVVELTGAGNILGIADVLSIDDMLWFGGVNLSGAYQIPDSHRINIGRVAPCMVLISVTGYAQPVYENVLDFQDMLAAKDLLNVALGPKIGLQPQIRLAGEDGVYGAWQNYVPGIYNAQSYDARVLLTSSDMQVTAVMSGFVFSVDVPDRIDTGVNVPVPSGGRTVTYAKPFNGGADGQPYPGVHVAILDAQQGDYLVLSGQSLNGFTVQVMNSGAGVARNINWTAPGY